MAEQRRYHALVLHSEKHHESETDRGAAYSHHVVGVVQGPLVWLNGKAPQVHLGCVLEVCWWSIESRMGIALSVGVNGPSKRPAKVWCRDLGTGVVEGVQKS